jgi:hypothetical protein
MGARVIGNSYGAPESSAQRRFNAAFNHPGHAITAGSNGVLRR